MAKPARKEVVRALLERSGRTYAEQLRINVESNRPSELFRLLCASLLFGARISADIAVAATTALRKQGWTTAAKMADATWAQRAKTLNEAGYARYDERTSGMLGDTAALMLDRYRGDLRRLREDAERDPKRGRVLLKQFKGIGDVGVDIFFREVQVAWEELVPFADRRALKSAERLGLPADTKGLAKLVDRHDFARLIAALVRTELAGDHDAVRRLAAGKADQD